MAAVSTPQLSSKRKRQVNDQEGRYNKQQNMNGSNLQANSDAFAEAQLSQMLGMDQHGMSAPDDSTRTAQAALATPMQASSYPEPSSYQGTPGMQQGYDETPTSAALYDAAGQRQGSGNKPQVGSEQWHQLRKDNHKEVERRRREVINEGIENIAKIVPNVEKNKGAVLSRTHQYIGELQAKERQFETERATFEVALKELTGRIERLRESSQSAWAESTKWQNRCRSAGLHFDDYDDGELGLGDEATEES